MNWNRLFGIRGRINRGRYWLFALIALPAFTVLYVAFYLYAMSFPGAYENGGPTPWPSTPAQIAGAAVWWLVLAALGMAWLALSVRRLHDRDRAWWWLLVFFVLPNGLDVCRRLWLRPLFELSPASALIVTDIAVALSVWGLVEMGLLRGTAGDNRYGRDPLAPTA